MADSFAQNVEMAKSDSSSSSGKLKSRRVALEINHGEDRILKRRNDEEIYFEGFSAIGQLMNGIMFVIIAHRFSWSEDASLIYIYMFFIEFIKNYLINLISNL